MSAQASELLTHKPALFSHVVILTYGIQNGSDPPVLSNEFQACIEELDVRSAFFEQHYLQKPPTSQQRLRPFGSLAELSDYLREFSEHQIPFEERSAGTELPLMTTTRGIFSLHSEIHEFPRVLTETTRQLQQFFDATGRRCVLIVTGWIGLRPSDSGHFRSPALFCECRHRTPLWIDTGIGHPCRVQALCGSLDILSTVREFLLGPPEDIKTPETEDSSDSQASESGISIAGTVRRRTPESLVSLTENPGMASDREILISGHGYDAIRTQSFLIVRKHSSHETSEANSVSDSASIGPDENQTELYVKPEDYWNVLDQAGTFQHVPENIHFDVIRDV